MTDEELRSHVSSTPLAHETPALPPHAIAAGLPPQPAPSQENDDEEIPLSPREKQAERLWRSAVLGLLVWPLQFYSLYLFVDVFFASAGKLDGKPRQHARWGALITLAFFAIPAALIASYILNPDGFDADLRDLEHPEIFVGRWGDTLQTPEGEVKIKLTLAPEGKLWFTRSGPRAFDVHGTWAYHEQQFLVRIKSVRKGEWPRRGETVRWALQRVTADEIIFLDQEGQLRLHRQ